MLGALVVSLGLDAAEFISGMSKSEQQAKKFASSLDRTIAVGIIKAEVALRSFGAVARTTFDAFQSITLDAAVFKDLEETTGASAESLASLAVAASTAGVPMENVAGSVNKLTKSLVGVDDESKAAGAALKSLGLNIAEFKQLDPAAQYEAVGKAINKFADDGTSGAAKVAAAMALFGKSGAEQLKVFRALEEQGGRQTILTQRQIELSDAYADAQAKAGKQLQLYAQAAASEAIPALTALTGAATDFAKELLGVDKNTAQLAANNGVSKWANEAVSGVADLIDMFQQADRGFRILNTLALTAGAVLNRSIKRDIEGGAAIIRQAQAEIEQIRSAPLFSEGLNKRFSEAKTDPGGKMAAMLGAGAVEPAKRNLAYDGVPDKSGAAAAAKEQKRILDGQIKEIQAFAQQQRDAFEFANRYVQGTYDAGLISLQDLYANEQRIRDAGLRATLDALDKEAEALKAARSKATGADRVEIENKIADTVARRAQAEQKASQDGILASQQQTASVLRLQRQYEDLQAAILQASGDRIGSSNIRIRQEVDDARAVLRSAGEDTSQADRYGEQLANIARLQRAQEDYGALIERTRLKEESLLLSAREYGATEWETQRALGVSRNEALHQMGEMVAKAQELAAAMPKNVEAQLYAQNLAVAFQRAAAEADPLLQKVRDIGGEISASIAGGLEDAIVQGRSFRDVLDGIAKDLLAIGTRELVTKPLGNALTNIIGGNGQSSGGGGLLGSIFGSLGFGGMFAAGGDLAAGKWGIAGEKGPELIRGPAHVVPTNRSMQMLAAATSSSSKPGQSMVNNFHYSFSGPVTKKTESQVASATLRGIAQGRRGN